MAESTYTAPATYTITFPSLSQSEVKVSINGVLQSSGFTISGYATSGSGTVSFTSAPASGAHVRIFRDTTILSNQAPAPKADFQAGASIQAADLNNNMDQVLYKLAEKVDSGDISADSVVTQAIRDLNVTTAKIANNAVTSAKIDSNILTSHANQVTDAANSAATATAAATTATNQATAATNQATAATNSAATAATEAASIAGSATAAQNAATAAQTQATASAASAATAITNATAAQTTAANAVTTANNAETHALYATNAANAAVANATTALNNSREDDGSGGFNTAISIANTASTTATTSLNTANTASSNANTAINTANSASAAVANAVFYTLIANFAAFPSSPSNQDRIEVADSTGLQSQSIIAGLPSGFTGSNDLTVRLEYNSSTSKWDFKQYFAADPESRYIPKSGGTFTGAVSFDDNVIVKGDATNGSGELTLNCGNNSHGIKLKGPPHSAGANYTITLPNDTGTNGQSLITNGSGVTSWSTTDQTKADIDALNIDADLLDGQHGSYYTGYTDTAVANIVDSSPATLNTLNELAAALGDDANFSTTVTNSIATKLPLAGGTLTGLLTVDEAVRSDRTGSTQACFSARLNGVEQANISAGGSATFAGSVDAADGHVKLLLDSGNGRIKLNSSSDTTNIDLFGSNGSATFAGSITQGTYDPTQTNAVGIQSFVGSTGSIFNIQAKSTVNAGQEAFRLFRGTSENITFKYDGSANFSKTVSIGSTGAGGPSSAIIAETSEASATQAAVYASNGNLNGNVFRGLGANNQTSIIKANGDATFSGTVSDSIGPLRRLGYRASSSGFTLAASDAGKLIKMTGNDTLTIPSGVFVAGDMISIFNISTGNVNINASAVTLYNTADAATGNRTIAAKGMATIVCTTSNEFAISGSQLT